MKGLDGKEYNWSLIGYNKMRENCSAYHDKARELLKEEFPLCQILEEVYLPGICLFADFYLPSKKMIIEIHGEQHYKQVSHFHGTGVAGKLAFLHRKKCDRNKKLWAELNGIAYIELSYEEDEIVWRNKIRQG